MRPLEYFVLMKPYEHIGGFEKPRGNDNSDLMGLGGGDCS